MKIINDYNELQLILLEQDALHELSFDEVIKKKLECESRNVSYTILSVLDENNGGKPYIRQGIRYVNNIGCYFLEGKFVFKDDFIEMK